MLKLATAAFALLLSSPVVAAPAQAAGPTKDPNRIVCERQEVLGSRLGGKKVCKTAAEWAEERRLHRDALERAQQATGVPISR